MSNWLSSTWNDPHMRPGSKLHAGSVTGHVKLPQDNSLESLAGNLVLDGGAQGSGEKLSNH